MASFTKYPLRLISLVFICGINGYILSGIGPESVPKLRGYGSTFDANITDLKMTGQMQDHFNFNNSKKYSQRYMLNRDFFKEGGPIFIYLDGNAAYSGVRLDYGHFYDIAQENNAMMFELECRYYAKSHPSDNVTIDDLQYLNTEQILSDAARFIQQVKIEYPEAADAKVIVAGTTIGASYAVWLAHKYPDLVDGVWASSPRLLFKHEYSEFREIQGRQIRRYGGDKCYDRIEEAFKMMKEMIEREDLDRINHELNPCPPLKPRNKMQVWYFFKRLAENMDEIIYYNVGALSIGSICNKINDDQYPDGLAGYAAFIRFYNGIACFNTSYDGMVKDHQYTNWPSNGDVNYRQWLYQECFEFNWFVTSWSDTQPFGKTVPIDFYYQFCSDVFKRKFSPENMKRNIKWKNELYGGLNPKVKNVFITNGERDPYYKLSVLNLNDKSSATVIDGFHDGKDLEPMIDKIDTMEMTIVKERVRELVRMWLKDE